MLCSDLLNPAFVVLQVILVMCRNWLGGMTPINPMYVDDLGYARTSEEASGREEL